jgi:nucleoside-diphosphate-sugar epimerase
VPNTNVTIRDSQLLHRREYFFDRLVRGRPILIPGSGDQIVNIAHAGDNAHMIALAVGNPAAYGQIFNCVRDKGVTLDGLVHMCAAACGVKASIVHYDAKAKGVDAKKAFPFRTEYHFFSEPRAALMLLGWTPKNNLNIDLVERYREYRSSPRFSQLLAFDKDDDILAKL